MGFQYRAVRTPSPYYGGAWVDTVVVRDAVASQTRAVGIPQTAGPVQTPTRGWEEPKQPGLEQIPAAKAAGIRDSPRCGTHEPNRSAPRVPAVLYMLLRNAATREMQESEPPGQAWRLALNEASGGIYSRRARQV